MEALKEVIATYIEEGGKIKITETPLIRCGECIHRHEHEWYNTCDKHIGHGFEDDYFCKDGERNSKITQIEFEKLELTQIKGE